MNDALPIPCRPTIDESAISFIERLAEANGLRLRAIKSVVSKRVVDNWTDDEWDRLAALSGRTLDELHHLRRRLLGSSSGIDRVMGEPIRSTMLIRNNQRICPECVADSGMLLAAWDVAHAVACPRHGKLLIAHCDCGRPLGDRRRGPTARSCSCGLAYADMSTMPADDVLLRGSAWILHALTGRAERSADGAAPDPFGALRLGDLLITMELIGRAATTAPTDDPVVTTIFCSYDEGGIGWDVPIEKSAEVVAAAVPIMEDWPSAYLELLDEYASRNPSGQDAPHRFRTKGLTSRVLSTRMGTSLMRPWRGIDGRPVECLVEIADLWSRTRLGTPRKIVRPTVKRVARREGVYAKVCARTGDDPLRWGTKASYSQALNTLPDDLSDVAEIENRIIQAMSIITDQPALRMVDGSHRARIEHWLHPELLVPVEDGRAPRGVKGFARHDVDALRERLARAVRLIPSDELPSGFVPIAEGARQCTALWYPKQRLILDVLGGAIPTLATRSDATFADWFINAEAASRVTLAARVRWLWNRNGDYPRWRLQRLFAELWPGCTPVDMDGAAIRRGDVDARIVMRKHADRVTPQFQISLRSSLRAQHRSSGPSPVVDMNDLLN